MKWTRFFTDTSGVDSSVPITWAYNHHYEAYLRNGENSFEKIEENKFNSHDLGQYNHGARKLFKLVNGTGIVIIFLMNYLMIMPYIFLREMEVSFAHHFTVIQMDTLSY